LIQQPGDVAEQGNLGLILGRDKRGFSSPNIPTTSQAITHWAPRDLPPDVMQLGHAADHSPCTFYNYIDTKKKTHCKMTPKYGIFEAK
jgi:hypothetical protein